MTDIDINAIRMRGTAWTCDTVSTAILRKDIRDLLAALAERDTRIAELEGGSEATPGIVGFLRDEANRQEQFYKEDTIIAVLREAAARIEELEAARQTYADALDCNVGSIHAAIRELNVDLKALAHLAKHKGDA